MQYIKLALINKRKIYSTYHIMVDIYIYIRDTKWLLIYKWIGHFTEHFKSGSLITEVLHYKSHIIT